jgi:hypothetical protein
MGASRSSKSGGFWHDLSQSLGSNRRTYSGGYKKGKKPDDSSTNPRPNKGDGSRGRTTYDPWKRK